MPGAAARAPCVSLSANGPALGFDRPLRVECGPTLSFSLLPFSSIMSYDAAAVAKHEELRLVTFSSEVAFTLGVRLREHLRSKFPGEPAIIDIRAAASEQQYFFATCAEGSVLDQMRWAQRKRNVVLRWGKSTASMNIKTNGGNIPAHYGLNTDDVRLAAQLLPLPCPVPRPQRRRRLLDHRPLDR